MLKYDLHVHTHYSDGRLSPTEIVQMAISKNLNGIAITDHDTILGIEEAVEYSRDYKDFNVIPGIEFSSVYKDEEVHILGYFIDLNDEELISVSNKLRNSRKERAIKIVEKLNLMDIDISIEEVMKYGKEDFVGRVHIARVLKEKKYVANIQEAFSRYLNRGKSAYVERYYVDIESLIKLIKKTGGIAVLAHPGLLKDKRIINHCIDKGIMGLECIHSKHSRADTSLFKSIAKEHDIIITGGSDCHGQLINGDLLLGGYYVNLDLIPEMKERI